jgi:hypothetical protein
MDRNRRQQGVKQMPTLTTCLELSEFEVELLPFEDPFSRGSMVIDFLEGWTAPRRFGKYPQILWGVGIDYPPVIGCRTLALIGF